MPGFSRAVRVLVIALGGLYLAGCGGSGGTPSSGGGALSGSTLPGGTLATGALDESKATVVDPTASLLHALRADQIDAVPAGGQQVLYDDFESDRIGAPAAGWSVQSGTWAVCQIPHRSLEYCQTAPGAGGESLAGTSDWKDYHVDAYVVPDGNPGYGGVAVIGRVVDATHFYELELKRNVNGSGQLMWYIAKYDGTQWTALAGAPFGTTAANDYELRLAFSGNRITAYVAKDFSEVFQPLGGAVDSSYSAGKVGLRSWITTNARFDKVRVTLDGATSVQPMAAVPADALVDIVGTNLHLGFCEPASNYCNGNYPIMRQYLIQAGIRHYRDVASAINYWPNNRFLDLANAGIHEDAVVGSDTTPASLEAFLAFNPTAESVEGPNEVNLVNDPKYPSDTIALMNTLAPVVHQHALPFIGPSIAWINSTINQYLPLAPISSEIDYGNLHDYFTGRNPGTRGWGANWDGVQYGSIVAAVFVDQAMAGSKPAVSTETGWADYQAGYAGTTPPDIVARYEPRLFLEHFRAGVHRVFQNQFLNYGGDHFASTGLIDWNMHPKAAYYALQNYTGTLADPGPGFNAKPLPLAVNGVDSNVHQLLMQKRDGTYWLALWVEGEAWNNDKELRETVPSQVATLAVGGPATLRLARAFNDDGSVTDTQLGGASSTTLTVTDHLALIEIK